MHRLFNEVLVLLDQLIASFLRDIYFLRYIPGFFIGGVDIRSVHNNVVGSWDGSWGKSEFEEKKATLPQSYSK